MYEKNPERTLFFIVKVIVYGLGGHSSVPYLTNNPILPAFKLIQFVSEKILYCFDSFQNVAFFPVELNAGTQQNIIPGEAFIKFRGECSDIKNREKILEILKNSLEAIEVSYQVKIKIEYEEEK